jgi:CRISPR-associated protein Csm4
MPLVQYILRPLSSFHFGTGREDDPGDLEDLPRSDTLVSAVLSVRQHADSASDTAIEAMAAAPPFVLSSAMPTLERDRRFDLLAFLPPGLTERIAGSEGVQKSYRRARFASLGALRALLDGKPLASETIIVTENGGLLSSAPIPKFDDNPEVDRIWRQRLWLRESRPRLSIDRLTGKGVEGILFRYATTFFRRDLYLSVLADFRDPSCRPVFETALRILGDDGIGGGRSIGHGRFAVHKIIDSFEFEPGTGGRLLLSLMHPTKDEIAGGLLDPPAVYTLTARGG